jgi:ABC-2 type transport system permease protein
MTATAAQLTTTSALSRVYGFGSVFAKTLRDSRLAVIIVAGLVGMLLLSSGVAFGQAYATEASRQELVALVRSLPPAMTGVYGNPFPAHIETLGGSIGWKTGASLGLLVCLWSLLALSGTLAGEARKGSLEFVATTPLGMRRIAIEKLAAHLTGMAIVFAVTAISTYIAGNAFATLPGDAISLADSLGFAAWVALVALATGSVAWALAPFVGRGASAALAGAVLLIGYFANGYQATVPDFAPLADLTWFGWTAHHQPLAGEPDWPSLVPVALVAIVLFAVGIWAFARRDLGVTSRIPWPGIPSGLLGLTGPTARSFGERLPVATWWGIGVGLMGFIFGAAAPSFSTALARLSPDTLAIFKALFPSIDLFSGAGAFLQLAFITFGFILAGFAASTLVGGWASEETSGRLEVILSAPLSRAQWLARSGLGLFLAVGLFTVLLMAGIALGSVTAAGDVLTPIAGTVVLGLYALALAGIGVAFGGLVSTAWAGELVAGIVLLTFLIDLLVPALKLPDWIHQLALTSHLGQPMVGAWDPIGIAACLALAFGGLALGAVGVARRDVDR